MARSGPEVALVRHGETEWSRSGQHTGRTDIPLTEAGREQAQALRPVFEGHDFVRVLTSPLARAADTCRLAGLGEAAEEREELLEWDYGDYEGLTTPEIRERVPGWTVWSGECPGGEAAADVGRRVDRVVAELQALRDGEGDAILFAHGHLLRVLAARWIDLPAEAGSHLGLDTGTLSVIGWERETPAVWLWNGSPDSWRISR